MRQFYYWQLENEKPKCLKELESLDPVGHYDCQVAVLDLVERWKARDPTLTTHNAAQLQPTRDGLWEFRVKIGSTRQIRLIFTISDGDGIGLTAFDKSNGEKATKKAIKRAKRRLQDL